MYKKEKFIQEPEIDIFEDGIENEYFLSQFKVLGRKYFQKYSELQSEPAFIVNAGNKFFELTKSSPIDEIFIRFDLAPYFWLYNSPVVKFIKNFYRLDQKAKSSTTTNSLLNFIDYYEKWAKAKTQEDKKYFSDSAINILDHRNFTKNYYLQLLNATIKIFDKTHYDPNAASELLNSIFENITIMSIDAEVKNEICYYINIFNGFCQLALNQPEKAGFYFSGALVHKKDGINAQFYSALADIRQSNCEPAVKRFVDLYNSDLDRLKYALEQNNVLLYILLCEFNIMQNFFAYDEFAIVVVDIHQEINSRIGQSDIIYQFLKNKVIDYNHVEHIIPKEPIHSISIQTVDLIVHKFARSTNFAFVSSLPLLEEKYVTTINDIISKIEGEFEKVIQEKLNSFHFLITESEKTITQLHLDLDAAKSNVKIKVDRMIAESKQKNEYLLAVFEDKLKNIDQLKDLNPVVTFKNGMSYSLFISVIILLVAGFASYSNSEHISEISNFRSMISTVIFTGTKWGIISFIIGMFFSALQAGSTVMERNGRKQNMIRKIQSLNEKKESDIAEIRKESEVIEKKMLERINERIKNHESRIVHLREEKEKEAVELREKSKETLNEDTKELRKLLVP